MQVKIKVWFAWWLPLYIHGVALMAALTGCQPDMGKVRAMVRRAMRTKVDVVA